MNHDQEPISGGQAAKDDSLSEDDLIVLMTSEVQETETEETETETEESTDAEETEQSEETEEEETEEEEEETEEADLDNLTDEQLEAYRIKFKSKLAADVAKLRKANREKEAIIAQLQAAQQPTTTLKEVQSEFLNGIETPEQLEKKVGELEDLLENVEDILEKHGDYGASDLIDVGGGKSYSKEDLRVLKKKLQKTLIKAVPFKQEQFRKLAFIEGEAAKVQERIKVEVAELSDEESPVAKNFKELTGSELFQKITKQFPEAKAVLPYLAAHALRSIHGKGAKPAAATTPGKTPKAKPPGNPAGVGAAPAKPTATKEKAVLAKQHAFFQSGSEDDLAEYLAAKMNP